jgi:DNA-binding GntR family transcriptional regulator
MVETADTAGHAVTSVGAMIQAIDDMSPVPRYRQIAASLEAEIRAGTWAPSNRVPSRLELSQRLGVNVGTVGRAHRYLARHGYLVSRPGIGMIVLPAERWPAAR